MTISETLLIKISWSGGGSRRGNVKIKIYIKNVKNLRCLVIIFTKLFDLTTCFEWKEYRN